MQLYGGSVSIWYRPDHTVGIYADPSGNYSLPRDTPLLLQQMANMAYELETVPSMLDLSVLDVDPDLHPTIADTAPATPVVLRSKKGKPFVALVSTKQHRMLSLAAETMGISRPASVAPTHDAPQTHQNATGDDFPSSSYVDGPQDQKTRDAAIAAAVARIWG